MKSEFAAAKKSEKSPLERGTALAGGCVVCENILSMHRFIFIRELATVSLETPNEHICNYVIARFVSKAN